MNALKLFAVGLLLGLLGPAARCEEKPDYAKLIVGKWEVTKADQGTVPTGAVVEFAKDGKIKITGKKDGAEMTIEGTYKVEKDTFTMTMKIGDQEKSQTITITKMTDKEMATKDKDGKVRIGGEPSTDGGKRQARSQRPRAVLTWFRLSPATARTAVLTATTHAIPNWG
jgi:uncharacterized protein (TIGR03066 family)